jgi:hypothetical protein
VCALSLTDVDAEKLIRRNDQEREKYNQEFTKKNWLDARYMIYV